MNAIFNRKKKGLTEFPAPAPGTLQISGNPSVRRQIEMIHLTEQDLGYLLAVREQIKPVIPEIVDRFYAAMDAEPALLSIITEHSSMERLKASLTRHLQAMFDGVIDEDYLEQRKTIARIHVHIGLEPKWYIAAFESLIDRFFTFVEQLQLSHAQQFHLLRAYMKVLNLEQQLVLEAYEDFHEEDRQKTASEKAAVREKVLNTAQDLAAVSEQTSASTEELAAKAVLLEEMAKENLVYIMETEQTTESGGGTVSLQTRQFNDLTLHMEELLKRMEQLASSSDQIQQIVTLITSIADQTNLLSLNAAIEAARAGEYGKGFAVVAAEVRKLSNETKEAAGNVESVVSGNDETIRNMSDVMKRMEQAVEESVSGNRQVDASYHEIAAAISGMKEKSEQSADSIEKTVQILQEINQALETIAHSSDDLMNLSEAL